MPQRMVLSKPFSLAVIHIHVRSTLPDGKKPKPSNSAV